MADQQSKSAAKKDTHSKQSFTRPKQTPYSLLGEIVYDNRSPIARICSLATPQNNTSTADIPDACLVSGQLEHLEFDLSALAKVITCVTSAYSKDCGLSTGLDPEVEKSVFFKETKHVGDSRILSERCIFVGEILDFGQSGYCVRCVDALSREAFWHTIRSVGCVDMPPHKGSLHLDSSHLSVVPMPTVGRIIILERVSPEILVALHIALGYYFTVTTAIDLYTGYAKLGSQVPYDEMIQGAAYRARHYTIETLYVLNHDQRRELPSWYKQRTSVLYDDKYPADFYIGRGTTVMQLSEQHERGNTVTMNASFKPWKILVIPAVPYSRSWRRHRLVTDVRFANASEAWIWVIWFEHEDVYTGMKKLFQHISEKVSPPEDFMFNLNHIENLLFDDEKYTKSKLYFWAYQSLEMIQSELKRIIRRWEGYRPTAVSPPIGVVQSTGNDIFDTFTKRVEEFAKDMDLCVQKLRDLIEDCKAKQREIAALRDGLFNGSAVLESRNSLKAADQSLQQTKTAIAQGENIKALTLVSIFFLPLAFVTSVFGMTNLPDSENMNAFAVALVCICIPAYAIIGSIMNTRGMKVWSTIIGWLINNIPKSWRGSKYRVFRDLARETFRVATWDVGCDEEDGDAEKPKKSVESFRSSAQAFREFSIPTVHQHNKLTDANPKSTVAGYVGNATQQRHDQPSESQIKDYAPVHMSEGESRSGNTLDVFQRPSPPQTAVDGMRKWRPNIWSRRTQRKDAEKDQDVEKLGISHTK